jgi:hypothetical protein
MAMRAAIAEAQRGVIAWLVRHAPLLLAGVLPSIAISVGVARFILEHFFVRAPYLLDSGFLSAIAYRDGLWLSVPKIACDYADSFYEIYVTPLMTLFSMISYVVPLERIEWYAVVQACVYLPIGIGVYVVASRCEPGTARHRLPVTTLAAFAFAFSGIVLWTVGYPHFEIVAAGLNCLLLACVVTERKRATWIVLVIAASVRQDAGMHAALALTPLLLLRWRGNGAVPPRKRLLVLIGVAISATVLSFAFQRIFFEPADRLREVYLGRPAYSHVTVELLADRAQYFVEHLGVIYYPVVATVFVSAVMRDANYLLGWAVTVPWFVFSITARDPSKGAFVAYTVAPFLVGLFWVYLYGACLAPAARRLRMIRIEALFAIVCVTSTLGYARESSSWSSDPVRDMVFTHRYDRAAVHGFVDALKVRRAELGKLYVDDPVAALALEAVRPGDILQPGVTEADLLVFHRRSWTRGMFEELAIAKKLDCARLLGTGIVACAQPARLSELLHGFATAPHRPRRRD